MLLSVARALGGSARAQAPARPTAAAEDAAPRESAAEFATQTTHHRIPTSTDVVLGAYICRPQAEGRYPVLMWVDPYRSGSDGAPTELALYYAQRGYCFAYVNSRGTGNSGGVSIDEYMSEETQDSYDAIAWLAEQDFSSGKVGMLGTSYSGFTTVQVAAMAPPALKAIAPAYFTDRRYTDDCHYKGGCLRGFYDMLRYGLSMVSMNALPPFPAAAGASWSELWQRRLHGHEPYLLKWIQHPTEDDYWARGSLSLDSTLDDDRVGGYDSIEAACLLIGGWYDGYLSPPLRTFSALAEGVPKKLLMGPWQHQYGNVSPAGPRNDIFHEMLRCAHTHPPRFRSLP